MMSFFTYFLIKTLYEEDFEREGYKAWTNWINIYVTLLVRCSTCAAKYGFYSNENIYLLENYELPHPLLSF